MSLLSTSHTHSFKRTKSTLHTIILSICFVFVNSAFAISNSSSSISQNTEVYLVTTDWIDSNSSLIFNPRTNQYYTGKTESSNSSLVLSQPFPNPDSDGDGIEDAIDIDDDNDGILDDDEKACTSVPNSSNSFNGSGTYTLTGDSGGLTIDILQLDNSFNMNINGTSLVPTQVQFDLGHYNSSGGQSLVRFVSDGETMNSVHGISSASPNDVSVKLVIDPNGEVSLYGSKTPGGALELMYIQTGDPQFNTISLNESGNNTVQITQMSYGPTYINGGYYFSELVCSDQDTNNNSVVDRLDLDSDGDGCPDALEGAGTFTSSDLDSNNRLSGGVDTNGVPTQASGGQDVGTSQTANPVLVEADHIDLAVSDATYSSYTENVVFTISNAIANFTYELVDASGTSFSPPVMATQGANTGDLDLTLSYANVPTDSSSPTFKVVAGGSNACTVTLTAEPTLSPADTDNDGTPDITDLDDDGDGIPDSVEDGSGYLSDLSIWLDANDAASITIDNYYTADEWRDKSGNERHVSNQVGDPQTGVRTINGLNVIDFTSSRMATSSIASWLNNTSYTIIAVTQFDNNTEVFMGTDGNGNNQIMHHGYVGSNWTLGQFGGGNGTSWSTSLSSTTPVLSVTTAAHPTYEALINGTSLGIKTASSTQLSATGPFNIGRPEPDGGWGYYDGTIAEIIIISDEITSVKRQKIEGYLAHKWGLEGNLPSNHPYATSPPPPNNDVDNDGIPNSRDSDSDGDGCPDAQERDGQDIGTSQTANPVLDASEHINLAVSDVSYSSSAADAVFTITNALANFTYELVDSNGASLNPQVLATQGSSTGDLDLTLLAANVPTGATTTTFEVVAGVSNACTVTLTDEPTLTLVDTDGDGVADITDLDDDNDGILDTEESNNVNVEEISETLPIGDLPNSTGLIRAVVGSPNILDGTQYGVSTTPFSGTNYISFHTDGSGARSESFSIQLSEPLNAGETLNISFQAITLDDGVREWDNSSKIHIDGGNSFGDDSVNLYITPSTGNNSEGWKNYSFNYVAASAISHITIYNISDTNAESFVGIDNMMILAIVDTDSDGIPNSLDLDSDGDGCSDALEAGATTNTTADYVFTGAVGANGLVDTLETSVDSGVINYTSTYNPNAVSDFLAGCVDTDSDGVNDLLDIDDDNDGILDATESPSCYYLANDVAFTNATTSLTNYSTNAAYSFTELYDGVLNNMAAYGADNTSITDETVYELELLFPVELSEIDIVVNYSVFRTGAEFKWQGYNGSTWVDVTGTLTETQATNTTITYTLNSTGTKYYSYRLQGISGATWYNRIYEIVPRVDTATYQSSLHPKDNCSVDTDGDGTYNHLDLDSDGDGCLDTIEAGTSDDNSTTDANNNGLLDQYEDGTTGTINYTSTYSTYAINDAINACTDTDGDGVNDVFDLDDDNDGILDTVEQQASPDSTFDSSVSTTGVTMTGLGSGLFSGGYLFSTNSDSYYVAEISKTMEGVSAGSPFEISLKGIQSTAADNSSYFRIKVHIGNTEIYNQLLADIIAGSEPANINLEGIITENNPTLKIIIDRSQDDANTDPRIVSFDYTVYDGDEDNDGIPNHLDLDSDGDGCNDSIEGVSPIPASPWSPAELTTQLWLDASDSSTIEENGGKVSRWDDKSGNNNHATQSNSGNQPTKGIDKISFIGGNDNMVTNSPINNTDIDIYYVRKQPSASSIDFSGGGYAICSKNGDGSGINSSFGTPSYYVNGTSETPANRDQMHDIIDDNTMKILSVVGGNLSSWSSFGLSTYGGEWRFDGDFYEIILVDGSNVDIETRQKIEGYLAHKWGLEASLPVDHPYKNAAPESTILGGGSGATCNIFTKPSNNSTSVYNTGDDTNTNGLLDAFEGAEAGTINYTSRYVAYALDNSINACTDSDGDDVGDIFDLDDDNDGVLDTTEGTGDTDNDGTPNHLDTDSDGDGCLDTIEAGTTNNGATTDANCNGLLDQYEDGVTNNINYTSTYNPYALNNTVNSCVDSDSDGVNDVFDIDDDNDGVLDTEEGCQILAYDLTTLTWDTAAAMTVTTANSSTLQGTSTSSWKSALSTQTFSLPLDISFTYSETTREVMVGFAEEDSDLGTNWQTATAFGFYIYNTNTKARYNNTNGGTVTSNSNGKTHRIVIDAAGNLTTYIDGQVTYQQTGLSTDQYKVYIAHNSGTNKPLENVALRTANYPLSCDLDTDGDGTPNGLDLDSDGDGCSDALEAGATTNTTADYVFTGAVGANGLVDTLETSVDSGVINYTSTYNPNAVSDFLAGCVDTDSDGVNDLLDIDDDNDGILDATESPSCYYLANDVAFTNATTSLTNYSTNAAYSFTELYDGVLNNMAAYGADNTSITDETVYELELLFPVELSEIDIVVNYSVFRTGAEFKWQGYNGSTWVDVTGTLTETQATNTTITYTLNSTGTKYYSYRLQGISGATWYNRIYEIVPRVDTATYQSSLHPKDNCSVDTDNDGTYNHLDTDSDDDGCIDTTEANAQDDGDTGDANNNGLLDKYEDASTGTISYSSTYGLALDDNANACADTDGDGIGDLIDLDDDNDGILDSNEQVANNCQYLGTTTDFNGYTFNNDAQVAVTAVSQNSITVNRLSGSWVSTYSNKTYSLPMRLSFTVDNVNSASMIGLIGTSQNKDFTNWSTKSHLFYLSNASSYDIRDVGTTRTGGSYASGDEFIIDIDSSGNLVMTQNGQEKWTDTVTDTEFQFVLSTASTTPKPYNNIFLNDGVDNLPYGCTDIDTDGDTIPNRLDLDSDGDGCSDSIEGVSPIPANPWSPAEITTSVWLDAADASTITADGNGISQWDDKSGNDHHAVQTTNSYKPAHVQNDLAGKDGVDFYSNKSLRKNTGTQTVGYVIAILKAENATWNNYHAIFGHRANSRFGGFMQSGNTGFHNNVYPGSVWVDGTSKTVSTSGFSTIDSPHIWSYTPNGNTVKTLTNGYNMGSYDNNNGHGSATHYEVVVLPTIPTDQERQILEGYLAHKWDLAANLPDGHPYKNAAPESTIVGGGSGATCNIFTKPSNNSTSVYNTGDDTNNNGLLDAFEGAEAGTTNYTSSYAAYALDNTINACTDSDGDDVGDIFDLDDDNDGVLDTTEGTGDTDGDGTPNHLDTDSDNDGCLDTIEAGTTNNGATTDANCNGLLDQYEDGVTNTINYTSTYSPNAVSDFLAGCVDTDSDGVNDLLDIDDDNDGILDATESPSCYYLANEVAFTNATTSLTNYSPNTAYSFTELYDGVLNNMAAYGADGTSITDETVYELELLFPVELSEIDIVVNYSVFRTGAEFKWQGYNGSTWVDVTGTLTETQATNTTITYTLNSTGTKYYSYRLQGISGATWYNRIYEIVPRVDTATYQSSLHPKDNCSVDTDNDGTYNHLDTDSDDDTCIDTIEAGTSNDGTTTDANNNGLLDQYEDGTTGTISYSSTYGLALDDNANACADTDGDGIGDLIDLDDDNDGILDSDEQVANNCQYLGTTTDFNGYTFNNDAQVAVTAVSENSITVNRLSGSWVSTYSNKTYSLPMRLSFTVDNVNSASMIGLIGTSQDKHFTDWSKKSHLFYFINASSYDIRDVGTTRTGGSYASGDEFIIDIDSSGNLVMTQNGEEKWTDTVTDTEFQFAVSTASTTPKPYNNIFLNDGVDNLPYVCTDIDTDGDTIPNRLDLDSDGDTCIDTIEAGTSNDGTTTDANNNGLLDQYEDGTTGTINYTSTYSTYAINDAINACTDTDGDGVNDVFDLDDDNDGILDTVELLSIDAALWLDASDPLSITKDSNGLVSQWNDKSGNGHHATQSTEQPKTNFWNTNHQWK